MALVSRLKESDRVVAGIQKGVAGERSLEVVVSVARERVGGILRCWFEQKRFLFHQIKHL